jgi:hypothetical protein
MFVYFDLDFVSKFCHTHAPSVLPSMRLYRRKEETDAPHRLTYRAQRRHLLPTGLSAGRMAFCVRDGQWRFPIGAESTQESTRTGFNKTGITGGGPEPSAKRQEGPDGPTKLSKHKVFANIARARSAIGCARVHAMAIVGDDAP